MKTRSDGNQCSSDFSGEMSPPCIQRCPLQHRQQFLGRDDGLGSQPVGQLRVLRIESGGQSRANHLGDEVGLSRRKAGHQIAQGAGQFHQCVGVHDIGGNEASRVGQGSDVGAGENSLIVIDFGKSQRPPQSPCLIHTDAGSFGDLPPGVASVACQQSPADHLRRGEVFLRSEVGIHRIREHLGSVVLIGFAQPGQQCCQEKVAAQPGYLIDPGHPELDESRNEIGRTAHRIHHLKDPPNFPSLPHRNRHAE